MVYKRCLNKAHINDTSVNKREVMKLTQGHTTIMVGRGHEASDLTVEFMVYAIASKVSLTAPNISLDK